MFWDIPNVTVLTLSCCLTYLRTLGSPTLHQYVNQINKVNTYYNIN